MNRRKAIPIFKDVIIRNPNANTLFPINWEEKLGEDRCGYEEEVVFDEGGNDTIKKTFYIVVRRLAGFYKSKKPRENKMKPLFEIEKYCEEGENE